MQKVDYGYAEFISHDIYFCLLCILKSICYAIKYCYVGLYIMQKYNFFSIFLIQILKEETNRLEIGLREINGALKSGYLLIFHE